MMRRLRLAAFLACGLSVFFAPRVGHAEIVSAGDLLVDLRLEDFPDLGSGANTWPNQGTLGGTFNLVGSPSAAVGIFGPGAGVTFDGNSAFKGPNAPAGITGNGTRSVEVWAFNPVIADEETLVGWGRRGGPNGSNVSFNYGANATFGAVGHWGQPDMSWGGNLTPQVPTDNQWHHLVYTYDGTTARLYSDGVLKYNRNVNLNTHGDGFAPADDGDFSINVGGQNSDVAPFDVNAGLRYSGGIAYVRVHDGVLSDGDVRTNYLNDAEIFGGPPLPPVAPPVVPQLLSAGPKHRYTFDGNANDSVGTRHGTVVNPSGLDASFTTMPGQLDLRANNNLNSNQNFTLPATRGAYVDLPNGTISTLGTQATFEAWITEETQRTWARVFDFGKSDGAEDTAGGAANSSYLMLTPRALGAPGGAPNNNAGGPLRFANRSPNTAAGFNENFVDDNVALPAGVQHHLAVVWDETAGTQRLYVDGIEVEQQSGVIRSTASLAALQDTNNFLGRAQWGDPLFDGLFNEFRIYDRALSAGEILGNFQAGPDTVNVIPEPGTVIGALAVLALLAARRLRRRR
jgi:hypothetical protein